MDTTQPGLLMLLSALLLVAPPAVAQDVASGVDGHGFDHAPLDRDIRDPILVQRAGAFTQGDVFLGTLLEMADRPVVDTRGPVLDELYVLNASFGVAVHDRVRLAASVPYFMSSTGVDGFQDSSFGDTRVEVFTSILRPELRIDGGGGGVGVNLYTDLPTGPAELLLGNPKLAGGGSVAATYEIDVLTLSADAGLHLGPKITGLTDYGGGAHAILGAAIGTLYTNWTSITAELRAMPPFAAAQYKGRGMPAEAVFSHRLQPNEGFHFMMGASLGLTDAPGTPYTRVFAGLGGASMLRPRRDSDPLTDLLVADNCPLEPETINDWLDEDGCPDELASLAVTVVYAGAPVPGTTVDLIGPEGRTNYTVGEAPITVPQAVPGSTWRAEAAFGECLAGTATATASEGGTELVVVMDKYEGQVRVEAVDPEGAFIPEATIDWLGDAWCNPVPQTWTMPEGHKIGAVGIGPHDVVVKAPGYSLSEQTTTISKDGEALIRAVLEPTMVRVEAQRITIMDQIHFETAKAIIKPDSYGLLDQVAAIIKDNPQVGRVEIAGHTDNRGGDDFNLTLSQDRAESVRDFLVRAGVPADRLLARGYGETLPIDTNVTREGRANNRRVEFNLIDQAEEDSP